VSIYRNRIDNEAIDLFRWMIFIHRNNRIDVGWAQFCKNAISCAVSRTMGREPHHGP
jgi:hypothetical protein